MNLYNYCSKCGNELSDKEQRLYNSASPEGPVLCSECVSDMTQAISDAQKAMLEALGPTVRNIAEAIEDMDLPTFSPSQQK